MAAAAVAAVEVPMVEVHMVADRGYHQLELMVDPVEEATAEVLAEDTHMDMVAKDL